MSWVRNPLSSGGRHIKNRLTAGFLVLIPIGVTVLIVKVLFDLLDPPLQGLIEWIRPRADGDPAPGWIFPGLGLISLVVIAYLMGLVASVVVGRRLIGLGDRGVGMIPVIKSIYGVARQATEIFSNPSNRFKAVVLVAFPWGSGMRSIGLVTGRLITEDGVPSLAVFVPTAPNPSSGFLAILPEEHATYVDLSVDDAMRMVVSGGILIPSSLKVEGSAQDQPVETRASNQ